MLLSSITSSDEQDKSSNFRFAVLRFGFTNGKTVFSRWKILKLQKRTYDFKETLRSI